MKVGFSAPIMAELSGLVEELERHWKAAPQGRTAAR
jgi:hypothetical protein